MPCRSPQRKARLAGAGQWPVAMCRRTTLRQWMPSQGDFRAGVEDGSGNTSSSKRILWRTLGVRMCLVWETKSECGIKTQQLEGPKYQRVNNDSGKRPLQQPCHFLVGPKIGTYRHDGIGHSRSTSIGTPELALWLFFILVTSQD
jgi:hypothetical protein